MFLGRFLGKQFSGWIVGEAVVDSFVSNWNDSFVEAFSKISTEKLDKKFYKLIESC